MKAGGKRKRGRNDLLRKFSLGKIFALFVSRGFISLCDTMEYTSRSPSPPSASLPGADSNPSNVFSIDNLLNRPPNHQPPASEETFKGLHHFVSWTFKLFMQFPSRGCCRVECLQQLTHQNRYIDVCSFIVIVFFNLPNTEGSVVTQGTNFEDGLNS